MGYGRKVILAALLAALISAPAAAREPLLITKTSRAATAVDADGDAMLTVVQTRGGTQGDVSPEQAIDAFERAIGQAISSQQQEIQAACRSTEPPKPSSAATYDWRARCSYVRR
jgi:ABC-type glycerol-3-phosphate transport system substrate-binding protein